MNECGETGYRGENVDDQVEIFFLEDGNGVPLVRTASVDTLHLGIANARVVL